MNLLIPLKKPLGILLDSKLNFDSQITCLCEQAGQKLCALARINHCLTTNQKIRKCNAIDKMIFNMDNKTSSLKCERSFIVKVLLSILNIKSENLGMKLRSKIIIQLLSSDLDVYLFKYLVDI